MANFNLADYETVEERIKRFYTDNPDGRIITEQRTTPADREKGIWVMVAFVYLNAEQQGNHIAKASGYAFEIDGGNGANRMAALENAETSAIGRALANAGYSGNKRASREEMAKANRPAPEPVKWDKPLLNWSEEIAQLKDADQARGLFALAKAEGASKEVLDNIVARGKELA